MREWERIEVTYIVWWSSVVFISGLHFSCFRFICLVHRCLLYPSYIPLHSPFALSLPSITAGFANDGIFEWGLRKLETGVGGRRPCRARLQLSNKTVSGLFSFFFPLLNSFSFSVLRTLFIRVYLTNIHTYIYRQGDR